MIDEQSVWSPKDPGDTIDRWFNWDRFLPAGLTITDHTLTVPAGLTAVADDRDEADRKVRVRVSGGTLGSDYDIICVVTASDGQVFRMKGTLRVRERSTDTE